MSVLLSIERLFVDYGGLRAVNDVSIAVPEGRLVALLGPNGAGKSSLLRAVTGLGPRTGCIALDGERIDRLPAHRIAQMGICFVPEGRGVFGSLTVAENFAMAGAGEAAWRDRVLEAFPALRSRMNQVVATLSGGEQQMLALARAVASDTRLLAMDEPSLGLAPRLVARIYDVIAGLRSEGRTILLVEQYASHALRHADLVHVMAHGKIVFAGEPGELPHAPPLVERYLGRNAS